MGKCSSAIRTFKDKDGKKLPGEDNAIQGEELDNKNLRIMRQKIQLINKWQSYELETVIEKIMMMCEYQKKNHMNFTLFLQFFPTLKPMSMKTQLKYFELFDFTRSSYINIRQIIFGISQIYFTPRSQYHEILKEIYKTSKGQGLTYSQLKRFLNENKAFMLPSFSSDRNFSKNIVGKQPISESDFELMIMKHFNIRQYQRFFDFYDIELEISILDDLRPKNDETKSKMQEKNQYKIRDDKKTEAFEIKIRKNDKVFLVNKNWFQTWVKYMSKYGCNEIIYQIQHIMDDGFDRRTFSYDEVFMENIPLIRPPKIYNHDLISDYETDLKPGLKIFDDIIPIPEKIWKKLFSIYKGGPQIERIYPHFFNTIIFNKVFIDNKGKFIEGKIFKCNSLPKQTITSQFKFENKNKEGRIYFMKVPKQADIQNIQLRQLKNKYGWQQLEQNTLADTTFHQGFMCFVKQSLKTTFQTNYKYLNSNRVQASTQINKQNYFSYGQILSFKTYTYNEDFIMNSRQSQYMSNLAYIVDKKKNQVKVHFIGCSDTCDSYFSIEQLQKAQKTQHSKNSHIVECKNVLTAFDGLQNSSYLNAILQVLISTPFFNDYFLKKKHIRSLSNKVNLQSCLSSCFSKIIYDVKKYQKDTIKPQQLYRKIQSKEKIDIKVYSKEYAEKYLCRFLQTLSQQLQNPQKLFDKYPIVQNIETNNREDKKLNCSIIEAFFKLSESTKNICSTCKSQSISTDYSYTLKVPLPEDQELCYSIIYYPVNSKQFIRYAITIKKSQKFFKYVHKFADLIKIDHSRISFAEIRQNQFRKHYTWSDYQSSLASLDLNPSDDICAFELRNSKYHRQFDGNNEDQVFYDKNLKLEIGSIVDFNMYTEWHVGKVIDFNRQKVIIENFDGRSEVQKKKVDDFKCKTDQKQWYQVDILHRRIHQQKQGRIEYFLMPSIVSIAQWMSWGTVINIIMDHVKYYFDIENYDNAQDKKNLAVANDLFRKLFQFIEQYPKQNNKTFDKKQDECCIFSEQNDSQILTRRTNSTKADTPVFKIKIFFKNSGQTCAVCSKKSIFQKQEGTSEQKYCYGCQDKLDLQQPMAVKVNPAKISIVLDWTPQKVDDLTTKISQKTYDDPTYTLVTTRIKNQICTIDDCFQLYSQTNKKVQIQCRKCGRNPGQQTRYLSQCPNILVIHLNRFKTYKNTQIRLNNKIQLKRQLTIQKIQMQSKKEDVYELYAIICQRQKKGIQKWYSCILKNKNVWIKCEDTHTTLIDFNKIRKQDIYMAFYRKKNIKCTILSMIF